MKRGQDRDWEDDLKNRKRTKSKKKDVRIEEEGIYKQISRGWDGKNILIVLLIETTNQWRQSYKFFGIILDGIYIILSKNFISHEHIERVGVRPS